MNTHRPSHPSSPNNSSRQEWSLAIIGLVDSGKSTFLARLYGSGLEGPQCSSTSHFSLSFPPAIIPEESASIEKINELWEWICSNFDKKKKTFDKTDFSFNISGPGLENGLKVHCQDNLGEAFQPLKDSEETQIDKNRLLEIKKDLHRCYPHVHAAIILIESSKVDDPASTALVKSMLDFLPRYTKFKVPVMKLIIFTKAATSGQMDALHDKIQRLQKQWKKQGYSWVKVLACESLNDLEKVPDKDGRFRWILPSEDKEKTTLPAWIHSPATAILELPRMLVSYRRWRKIKLSLIITATIATLIALWFWQGYQKDCSVFSDIEKTPEKKIGTRLENYLTIPSHTARNFFYPLKHSTGKAQVKWNNWFFDYYLPHIESLEARTNELASIQEKKIWKHVNRVRFGEERTKLFKGLEDVKNTFTQHIAQIRDEAYKVEDPEAFIRDKSKKFPKECPSLEILQKENFTNLVNEYKVERKQVENFSKIVIRWKEYNDLVLSNLLFMANNPNLKFKVHNDIRRRDLKRLSSNIGTTGLESPYESNRLLSTLVSVLERYPEYLEILSTTQQILDKVKKEIQRLQELNSKNYDELSHLLKWEDRIEHCNKTIPQLKDLPESKEWMDLKNNLTRDLLKSQDKLKEIEDKIKINKDDINEQIRLVKDGIAAKQDLAPEHIDRLNKQKEQYNKQKEDISKAWETVLTKKHEFSIDKKTLPALKKSINDYVNCLQAQGRERIKDHANELQQIKEDMAAEEDSTDKKISDVRDRWTGLSRKNTVKERSEIRREVAIKLRELLNSYKAKDVQGDINAWESNIKGIVADTKNFGSSTDDQYDEALNGIKLIAEFGKALNIPESSQNSYTEDRTVILTKWANERWETIKKESDSFCEKSRFSEAIDYIKKYLSPEKPKPYEIYDDMAKKEINQVAKKWEQVICKEMGDYANKPIVQKIDFTTYRKKVDDLFKEYQKVYPAVSANLLEEYRKAGEKINDNLINWYTKCVDSQLEKSPRMKNDDTQRILETWDQVDKLHTLFKEIYEDTDLAFNPQYIGKAKRAFEILTALKTDTHRFKISISSLEIIMNGPDYWGLNNYPEPALHFVLDGETLWKVTLKDKKPNNSTLDTNKANRDYTVEQEKKNKTKNYSVRADWKELPDTIKYLQGKELTLSVKVEKQVSEEIVLILISNTETPGCLFNRKQKLEKSGNVKYEPKFSSPKTMSLVFRACIETEVLNCFLVGSTYNLWQ